MNRLRLALLAASVAVALCACDRGAVENKQTAAEAPLGPQPVAPESQKVDENAINAPLATEAYGAKLKLAAPSQNEDGTSLHFIVEVENAGTSPIYGVGTKPFNIGIQVLGNDGSPDGPGGVRDFMRLPLPLIKPGETAKLVADIPFDSRLEDRKLRFAVVQEFVRWYEEADQSHPEVGPFKHCGASLCDNDGNVLPR